MSNNNKNNGSIKDYLDTKQYHDTSTDDVVTKTRCRECYKQMVAGLNLRTNRVTTYEIDNYPNQLIQHEHPADVVTRTDLMHRTAIEFRHVCRPNRDDRRYLMDNNRSVTAVN